MVFEGAKKFDVASAVVVAGASEGGRQLVAVAAEGDLNVDD